MSVGFTAEQQAVSTGNGKGSYEPVATPAAIILLRDQY